MTKPNQQLDLLFAFTYNLDLYDVWITNKEQSLTDLRFLTRLATEWKACLANDDDALQIDSEFTRPAILCLLAQLKQKICGMFSSLDPTNSLFDL